MEKRMIQKTGIFKSAVTGIITLLLCTAAGNAFGGIVFDDGSVSKTFPRVTLKEKTIKIFRKSYERKWTMDTYARISETSEGIKVTGRTELKSSFHALGFTGGVFVDVKDSKNNLIYRISARTGEEASGYENGHDVGWGVNPNKNRVKSWTVIIPPELGVIADTVDIYQIRTKKKIDWNKAKAKLSEIANNLGNAIKDFFDSHGDEVVLLIVKYGPKIDEMNKAAQNGTLDFSEVCDLMNNILADAKAYEMISSSKGQNLINIIDAVKEIVSNGKDGWAPKNQELIIALVQDIITAISEKNITDSTFNSIIDNFEAFLNDKSGLVGKNLEPIEVVLVNTKDLIKDKLTSQQIAGFDTVIEFVAKINDYGQDPLIQQERLDCIFAAARSIIAIRSEALAGTLTPNFVHNKLLAFLDVNYIVLGLTEAQNEAIENIIGSNINIINNGTEGLLPKNQELIVDLIISIERLAANKSLDYDRINSLINDLEKVCNDKSEFVPSSMLDLEIILTNVYTLIEPKLKDNSNIEKVFSVAISTVSAINNWNAVPVANNIGVVFNGLRLAVDLLKEAQNGSITTEYAETQFNSWYAELEPILKELYSDKTEEIDAVKDIIDNTFAIIKNGKEGWDFEHWNAVVGIVKAGMEVVETDNQFQIMYTFLKLKADFEVLLENKGGFVADNGEYIENIVEGLYILSDGNEKVHDAVEKLIDYLEAYNSWDNAA